MSETIRPNDSPLVTVVGLGAGGWPSMPAEHQELVLAAEVLLGGERHLIDVPVTANQERATWPTPLRENLAGFLAAFTGRSVVALASGDPLVAGIGTTLIEHLGPEHVRVIPTTSSIALARAELGWSAESCAVIRVNGTDPSAVLRELAPGRRVLVLSADESTPARLAARLREVGFGASRMHVLGDLGSPEFSRIDGFAADWSADSPRLNLIGVELHRDPPSLSKVAHHGWVAGLPDEAFEHDGQLTKRDLRACALARLAPTPGEHLWDVGAGAGSVGIEWMRAHPSCTTQAVEANPERAARVSRNAAYLGVPGLQVITGVAPAALGDLRAPDAIFVGGGASKPGVIDACLAALSPGGRLVVHGVTVETEMLLAQLYAKRGGELTRVAVESAAPIGSFTGWQPARTVTQWAFTRGS